MTQSESTANEVNRLVKEIKKLDVERDLIRSSSLGDWAFKELSNEFRGIMNLMARLDVTELQTIHLSILRDLSRDLNHLFDVLLNISKFSVAQNRAEDAKASLINSFHEQSGKILESAGRAFSSLELTADYDLSPLTEKFFGKEVQPIVDSEELERQIKKAEDRLKVALTEMDTVLSALRAKSKEVGIERYSKVFGDESRINFRTSVVWLILIGLLLVAGIAYGYYLNGSLEHLATNKDTSRLLDNNNYVLQITIIRLLTITILFYALTVCMKNYRAQKHNQIINKHRHNALITFETFNAGTTDEGTKNAILLEATRAIFGNQPTGFGSKDTDVEGPTNQIIEILKTRGDKGTVG